MGQTVKKLLEIALAEKGYLEKASNSQLDDKTANAGSNNYTKYARDLKEAGYYNGNKNGYAWCDVFVDWCFYQLCGKDKAKAEAMTCQTGTLGAGVRYSAQYYMNKGRYFESDPQPGDQIFFYKDGTWTHTGIVQEVKNGNVYTIEGNYKNKVATCVYPLNYATIKGYGRPFYEEEAAPAPATPAAPAETTNTCQVQISVLKKGSKGATVKALQILLIGYGYSCGNAGVDGDFGSATDKAVRNYQKAKGLEVDGAVGPKTWAKLLGV